MKINEMQELVKSHKKELIFCGACLGFVLYSNYIYRKGMRSGSDFVVEWALSKLERNI